MEHGGTGTASRASWPHYSSSSSLSSSSSSSSYPSSPPPARAAGDRSRQLQTLFHTPRMQRRLLLFHVVGIDVECAFTFGTCRHFLPSRVEHSANFRCRELTLVCRFAGRITAVFVTSFVCWPRGSDSAEWLPLMMAPSLAGLPDFTESFGQCTGHLPRKAKSCVHLRAQPAHG